MDFSCFRYESAKFLPCLLLAFAIGCGGQDQAPQESPTDEPSAAAESSSTEIQLPEQPSAEAEAAEEKSEMQPSAFELPPEDAQPDTSDPKPEGNFELPDLQDGTQSSPAQSAAEIQYASWEAIEDRVTSTGKITVVDVWSTSCPPCIKEFPGLVRLNQELGSKVTCVGVDVDFDGRQKKPPESYAETVTAFLNAVGADFDNFICSTPNEDVYSELGIASIPAVLVFDAEGKLVKQFVDAGETIGFTYDQDIIPLVKSIL